MICVCEEPSGNKAATAHLSGKTDEIPASISAVSPTADHWEVYTKHAIKRPVPKYRSVEDKTKNAWQGIQRALGRLSGQINTNEDVFLK